MGSFKRPLIVPKICYAYFREPFDEKKSSFHERKDESQAKTHIQLHSSASGISLTTFVTCCLWNATIIINLLRNVKRFCHIAKFSCKDFAIFGDGVKKQKGTLQVKSLFAYFSSLDSITIGSFSFSKFLIHCLMRYNICPFIERPSYSAIYFIF